VLLHGAAPLAWHCRCGTAAARDTAVAAGRAGHGPGRAGPDRAGHPPSLRWVDAKEGISTMGLDLVEMLIKMLELQIEQTTNNFLFYIFLFIFLFFLFYFFIIYFICFNVFIICF